MSYYYRLKKFGAWVATLSPNQRTSSMNVLIGLLLADLIMNATATVPRAASVADQPLESLQVLALMLEQNRDTLSLTETRIESL